MHLDALAETLPSVYPIQITELHANLDMYIQSGRHAHTESTNTHADIIAARYMLLHSSSSRNNLERACLKNIQVYIHCVAFFTPILAHPTFNPKQHFEPMLKINTAYTVFHYTSHRLSLHALPPSLPFLPWPGRQAGRADMFRMCSGNGLIKNAKQLAITARGPNGH